MQQNKNASTSASFFPLADICMDTLKLSELIGQEVVELRFHYVPENEYGLQMFYTYLKLDNGKIIDIPKFSDDDDYLQLSQDNLSYLAGRFDTGSLVNDDVKKYFEGQKIVDFYFSYYNNEVDIEYSALIKLSNGYYLSENNSGPIGVTDIDLLILDENQFTKRTESLKEINVDVRSFAKTKNVC
jgi:hypothetical protein